MTKKIEKKVAPKVSFQKLNDDHKVVQVAEAVGFLYKDLENLTNNVKAMYSTSKFSMFKEVEKDLEDVKAKLASAVKAGIEIK